MTIKLDAGKPRWTLVSWGPMRIVVEVLTYGAQKYSPGNWLTVPNARERYSDAALRHLTAWLNGEKLDEESGLSHLGHACCCCLFLLHFDGDK